MQATATRARFGLVALVLAPTLLAGCVTGEGPITHETREIRPFQRVEIGSGIHLVLTIGPVPTVEVAAQANILPSIATEVSTDTLHIDATDDFTTAEPVVVTVTAPGLAGIALGGGANARLDGLAGADLVVVAKGGAQLTATGSATDLTLTVDGGSGADLGGLVASRVLVTLAGGAEVTVAADESVRGTAVGGARLAVIGGASVEVDASGGAEVVAR